MSGVLSLDVEYRAPGQLPARDHPWWHGVLGMTRFTATAIDAGSLPGPVAQVPLTPMQDESVLCEIWRATGPMQSGNLGSVHFRFSGQLLFGCLAIGDAGDGSQALGAATTQAYGDIFRVLDATGFRQLVRIWNYVADINAPLADGERYWQFNSARHDSFLARRQLIDETVPAASALGTPAGSPLIIYFLASATPMRTIENPRQVSAFRYPRQYGPRSPTFSRAALLTGEADYPLLVSGTASIVGHETLHVDDVGAQTRETLANISALVTEANLLTGRRQFDLERLSYKAYVRRPADVAIVAAQMRSTIGATLKVVFLQADICRRDLLVEIEAVGSPRACATSVGSE